MSKYNRKIIVAVSDYHSGNALGLCNPETELQDDMGQPKHPDLNEPQKYLWDVYTKGVQDCISLAGRDEIVVIHDGDVTHGNKYIEEVIGTRIADQIFIAVYNFLPFLNLKNVKTLRLAKGTGAHSFGEGSADVLVEKILKERTKKDIKTLYHGLSQIGGIWVDYAHHGANVGSRNWLRGNEARYYLRSIMMDEIQAGNVPPRLVLRGHYHSYVKETLWMDTYLGMVESTIVILPSMCMLGDHGRQATRSAYKITNGMVALEVINDKLFDTHFFGQTLDIRTREVI